MPVPSTIRAFDAWLQSRLGSRAARFRLAVTFGFLVAAVGFLAAGPGNLALSAQEDVWGLSGLFGQSVEQSAPVTRGDYNPTRPRRTRHTTHRHFDRATQVALASGQRSGNQQSMCVRLCDGYVFPVGAYHGGSDSVVHEAICQATCPGAATALYVMPAGSQTIQDAVAIGSGRPYSKLPDAYHYTTLIDEACTCQKPGARVKRLSLLKDFTLRRGDAVMTASGVKVFHGLGHYPYRGTDFVALARSRDVRNTDRNTFAAIERAHFKSSPHEQAFDTTASTPTDNKVPRSNANRRASRD